MVPQLRYARTTDDVTIAYTDDGRGPALIWLPPAPFSDVVAQYGIPVLHDAYARLSSQLRLILFDGRGSGHSQRDVADLSLEAEIRDLDAVVREARLTRFALFGYYHSVPNAIAYAARHPTLVSHLVLFGATARGPDVMSAPETQALLGLIERNWDLFVDSAAHAWMGWGAGENGRLMAEMFRGATSPAIARAAMDATAAVDVTAEVPMVIVPTLVLQSRSDRQVPAAMTQSLARSLPNGRIGLLAGSAASLFAEEADADLSLILGFLIDEPGGSERRGDPLDQSGLTDRELEVLRLIAGGETNLEIAHRLGLSIHTVERHAVNLYRKIGVRGRAEAAALAVRRGLV